VGQALGSVPGKSETSATIRDGIQGGSNVLSVVRFRGFRKSEERASRMDVTKMRIPPSRKGRGVMKSDLTSVGFG